MERIDFDEEQDIFINTEESFLGELNGEISFVVSSKPISRFNNYFGNINFEFNKKFATSSLSNIFSWNVLQTANTPEFNTGNNSFNEDLRQLVEKRIKITRKKQDNQNLQKLGPQRFLEFQIKTDSLHTTLVTEFMRRLLA